MQLQMETCDLDECDFLETQFKEYDTHEAFLLDEMSEYKGVIIQFTKEDGSLKYIHSPIGLNMLELENWESRTVSEYPKWEWICNHYWKIEKISCVLVERNRRWFSDNVAELAELWNTVLKERIEGYEHRAPNKKASLLVEEDISSGMCLFAMNENGKII